MRQARMSADRVHRLEQWARLHDTSHIPTDKAMIQAAVIHLSVSKFKLMITQLIWHIQGYNTDAFYKTQTWMSQY